MTVSIVIHVMIRDRKDRITDKTPSLSLLTVGSVTRVTLTVDTVTAITLIGNAVSTITLMVHSTWFECWL